MRKKRQSVNKFWTDTAIVVTGLSLIATGCSPKEAAKAEGGEMTELIGPSKEEVNYSNAISSLEMMLATEKIGDKQERDIRQLTAEMRENAASRARYEKRQ